MFDIELVINLQLRYAMYQKHVAKRNSPIRRDEVEPLTRRWSVMIGSIDQTFVLETLKCASIILERVAAV